MLPNCLIIGAVASGTSFLSSVLTQHPDIYLPLEQRPEPNFFHYTEKYKQGLQWYEDRWFSKTTGQSVVIDRSSLLLTSELAPARIYESIGNTKIIACLRNPIERAWANYRFTLLEGLENLTFRSALEVEDQRRAQAYGRWSEVQPHAYVHRSRYSSGLIRFLDAFGSDRILLLKSEALSSQPNEELKRVTDFLEVASLNEWSLPVPYTSPNVIDPQRQVELRLRIGDSFSKLVEQVRTGTMDAGTDTDHPLLDLQRNLSTGKQSMSTEERQMLSEKLHDELMRLRTILPFDISDWT